MSITSQSIGKQSKVKYSKVSKSRRKQRKAMFNASQEKRRIMMSSRLSKNLRAEWGFKSFPIHSQDVVVVKCGKFKGQEGKVKTVDRRTMKVKVDGCTMVKITGGTAFYPIDPSNLEIKELFIDETRKAALEKKKDIYMKTKEKYAARASN